MLILIDETYKVNSGNGGLVVFIFSKNLYDIPCNLNFGSIVKLNNLFITQRESYFYGSLNYHFSWYQILM